MKTVLKLILIVAAIFPLELSAQTYIKLNAPYAFVGIINAQAEFVVSPHSSVAFDAVYSPWRSFKGKHLNYGITLGEYRYYFKEATNGWYLSANAGMTVLICTDRNSS